MASVYSIISIETRLITHFSGYKAITLQTHHVDFTLKRRGNDRFDVVSMWNLRGVFVGYTSRKSNIICFKPRFSLFHLLKYYKILSEYSFYIGYSDILNKLATIAYSLCFKKQTLELLRLLSFKAELPTDGL